MISRMKSNLDYTCPQGVTIWVLRPPNRSMLLRYFGVWLHISPLWHHQVSSVAIKTGHRQGLTSSGFLLRDRTGCVLGEKFGYRDGTGSENLRVTNHTPVQSFSSLTSSHSLLWNRDRNKKDHLCSAKIQFQVSACILLFHVTCDSLTHWLTAWLTPAIWLESSYFGDLGSLGPLGPMCLW